ncbi:uncharacterized protein EURHEDRAFT_307937 [Aspergillus ruber CBS 135680]|uniref:Uncharacterized protein n=1 Tax=Aspergillus ruber (strain CBS 135680) TaxID=1388766 RepID=A0A017S167_ASPRC|nr:uncharacterized protein EURHEDRAFT_307937 [Aspergillus ruber CBS 135680]EYE90379.1 hypothetical protein EURHEDRAFT_307937 [Aspergillus ruber CBS 135680]
MNLFHFKHSLSPPPPPKKNKMPVILQQETPHTVRHHYTNLDAEMAMDIDDQAHNTHTLAVQKPQMIEMKSFVYFVMKLIHSAGLDRLSLHYSEGAVNSLSDHQNCLSDQIVDQRLNMRKGESNWKSSGFNEKSRKSERKKRDPMNLQRLTGEVPDAYKAGVTILNEKEPLV